MSHLFNKLAHCCLLSLLRVEDAPRLISAMISFSFRSWPRVLLFVFSENSAVFRLPSIVCKRSCPTSHMYTYSFPCCTQSNYAQKAAEMDSYTCTSTPAARQASSKCPLSSIFPNCNNDSLDRVIPRTLVTSSGRLTKYQRKAVSLETKLVYLLLFVLESIEQVVESVVSQVLQDRIEHKLSCFIKF